MDSNPNPVVVTPPAGDSTNRTADTAFVTSAIAAAVAGIVTFPSGTVMLFQQTSAPTGWTKIVTHDDKALRVVSGTVSSGGSSPFSTVFALTATDAHTLTIPEMPAHTHSYSASTGTNQATLGADSAGALAAATTGSAGGGGGHSHNINLVVQYVDVIFAQKDA